MENILLNKALKYVDDVLEDKEITTEEVKKQCKIFKEDYDINQYKDDFEFFFNEKMCMKITKILHLMNFGDGIDVTGMKIIDGLVGFQCFLLVNIFAWRYKDRPLKMRYRDVVLYIARKNAKTFIVALIFILLMLLEPKYSKFYSICLSKDLASEVREGIKIILESSPDLLKHFSISKTPTGKIECKLTKNTYLPRTAEAGKNNAIKPSAFVSDEHANFNDRSNYSAMRSGQKNVINPITIITTTGYPKTDSIMNDDLIYARDVLNGVVDNKRYFCLLYYAEKEHLWDDIGLYQANPLRIEDNYNEIRDHREKAKIISSEEEEYLTKEMNNMLETNEENKYMSVAYWKKCGVDSIDFSGRDVVVGVDLSVTTDLTAVSIMFKDEEKIYCKSHGFLPGISTKNRREKFNYKQSADNNECSIHKGKTTVQYTLVEEYIRNIEEEYNCTIKTIVTDPMNAKEMMERLEKDYDIVYLKQTYTNLSPATKEFRKKAYDGDVFYEKSNLVDWCMGNAVTTKGKSDDEMLAKENKNKERIDPIATLIFCYTEFVVPEEDYDAVAALDEANWD